MKRRRRDLAVILPAALIASSWACAAAAGPTRLWLEVSGKLPFTSQQLAAAVSLRVALADPGVSPSWLNRVRVAPGGAGQVLVRFRYKRRAVPVGAATGAEAARRVALAISDLTREAAAVRLPAVSRPSASRPAASRPASRPASRLARARAVRPAKPSTLRRRGRAEEPGRLALTLWAGAGAGSNLDRATFIASFDALVRVSRSFFLFANGGFAATAASGEGDRSARVAGLPIRGGAGWRPLRVPLEIRVHGLLQPYHVSATMAAISASRWGVGGGIGGTLGYTQQIKGRLGVFFQLSLDAFFNRADFLLGNVSTLATERVFLSGGIGLRVAL